MTILRCWEAGPAVLSQCSLRLSLWAVSPSPRPRSPDVTFITLTWGGEKMSTQDILDPEIKTWGLHNTQPANQVSEHRFRASAGLDCVNIGFVLWEGGELLIQYVHPLINRTEYALLNQLYWPCDEVTLIQDECGWTAPTCSWLLLSFLILFDV